MVYDDCIFAPHWKMSCIPNCTGTGRGERAHRIEKGDEKKTYLAAALVALNHRRESAEAEGER